MPITAELRVDFIAKQTDAIEGGTLLFNAALSRKQSFAPGTAANQADCLWVSGSRTLGPSESEEIDLSGVLLDAMGNLVAMAEVVFVEVIASAENTNDVILGDASAPVPWIQGTDPTIKVSPGGGIVHWAPGASGLFSVGDSATDELKVANSGGDTSVTFTIAVLGRSA